MENNVLSIRPFIGAKNFELSRKFYQSLGFEETIIDGSMSVFKVNGSLAFYLQNAYVQDWVDNSMLFLEVENVEDYYKYLLSLNLPAYHQNVRLSPIRYESWGAECFLHDPSGILWHIGSFKK